jgi:cyanophycinase
VVIPSATSWASPVAAANRWKSLGATTDAIHVKTRKEAADPRLYDCLDRATGVWFGGGDQNRLIKVLRGTRTAAAIRARYEAGAVIGGTSAGAAVMSEVMLTGDERRPGGDRPDTVNANIVIARENVVTDTGFALIRNAIIDQHFLRRKRHNRLISLVLEREPHLGAGIDESTAIVVGPDGKWEIVGASAVVVYDARSAKVTPASARVLGASGMVMHVLPAGSRYDPRSGTVSLP